MWNTWNKFDKDYTSYNVWPHTKTFNKLCTQCINIQPHPQTFNKPCAQCLNLQPHTQTFKEPSIQFLLFISSCKLLLSVSSHDLTSLISCLYWSISTHPLFSSSCRSHLVTPNTLLHHIQPQIFRPNTFSHLSLPQSNNLFHSVSSPEMSFSKMSHSSKVPFSKMFHSYYDPFPEQFFIRSTFSKTSLHPEVFFQIVFSSRSSSPDRLLLPRVSSRTSPHFEILLQIASFRYFRNHFNL